MVEQVTCRIASETFYRCRSQPLALKPFEPLACIVFMLTYLSSLANRAALSRLSLAARQRARSAHWSSHNYEVAKLSEWTAGCDCDEATLPAED